MLASLGVVPLVMYGITLISRLQLWSQPIWTVLFILPYAFVAWKEPQRFAEFSTLAGRVSGNSGFDGLTFGAACTVAFSLVVQIGEQVDYLRFLPEKRSRVPAAGGLVGWWAVVLLGVLDALERVLGLYSNVAIAWVGALVADLVINKPLGWSPKGIEFRRAYRYDISPVGLGAMLSAAALAITAHTGLLGPAAQAFAPFIALGTSVVVSPLLAWWTRGRWYLARQDPPRWHPGAAVNCSVGENPFGSDDRAWCPTFGAAICSLCCTLESRCHDRCKTESRSADQVRKLLTAWLPLPLPLPLPLAGRINFRVAHYLVVAVSLMALLGVILGLVYEQQAGLSSLTGLSSLRGLDPTALRTPFLRAFALLSLALAVGAWGMVLGSESRHRAEDESNRQNLLLTQEIEAHRRTDTALQAAKDQAESANQAKTRYVAGITHALRTPLNSILGYAQILLKDDSLTDAPRPPSTAVASICTA